MGNGLRDVVVEGGWGMGGGVECVGIEGGGM